MNSKKEERLESVNHQVLATLNTDTVIVTVQRAEIEREKEEKTEDTKRKAEVDEMQSFVGKKENQRWLWHAIDHCTGEILAYVLGSRQDEVFLKLKKLLEPFGIKKFYTDGLKTYERHLPVEMRQVSKYKMQRIERKHLTFRTRIKRLARKTICFSKSIQMHDLVIGLFINKYEFGVEI